jgi:hypothetical protein
MKAIRWIIWLLMFCLSDAMAYANEKKDDPKKETKSFQIPKEDAEIIEVMEILQLMDMMKDYDLIQDMEILIEEKDNEDDK